MKEKINSKNIMQVNMKILNLVLIENLYHNLNLIQWKVQVLLLREINF